MTEDYTLNAVLEALHHSSELKDAAYKEYYAFYDQHRNIIDKYLALKEQVTYTTLIYTNEDVHLRLIQAQKSHSKFNIGHLGYTANKKP